MKKQIFTLFLVILMLVTNMSVCYADGLDSIANINIGNYQGTLDSEFSRYNNSDLMEKYEAPEEPSPTGLKRTVMTLIIDILQIITDLLLALVSIIIPTMDSVIFNEGVSLNWGGVVRLSYFDVEPKGMAGQMVSTVSNIYQVFRYVALIFFVIAIALIAVKMIVSSVGKQKQKYKDDLKHWVIGLVLLVVGHWIMIYAIYFSDYLVELIRDIKNSALQVHGLFGAIGGRATLSDYFSHAVMAASGTGVAAGGINAVVVLAIIKATKKLLGWIGFIITGTMMLIAIIAYAAMNIKVFKVYLERVIIVGVLIMIFPLVTVFYALGKSGIIKGSAFEGWLKTFFEQVYIQPIHAISLFFVMVALDAMSKMGILAIPIMGMVFVIMTLNTVFEIENVVKRVISIGGAKLGQPANMMSAAATVGMGINAGLQYRNTRHLADLVTQGLPNKSDYKEGGQYSNGKKFNRKGYKDALKAARKTDAAKAARSAVYRGAMQDWMFDAMGRSPLHIDTKLFNSNLSQGERRRVERKVISMLNSGKVDANNLNDVVELFKDISREERVQILTGLGLGANMTAEDFAALAKGNQEEQLKFFAGCARMVDFDSKESLKDIRSVGNSNLSNEQLNTLAAALSKASDKMEELKNIFGTDFMEKLRSYNPTEIQGIAAVLEGAKANKVFYEPTPGAPREIDYSYLTSVTKEQAHAIVNTMDPLANYEIPQGKTPMDNIEIKNVISAAATYREKLSPEVMNMIIESVEKGISSKFENFLQTGQVGDLGSGQIWLIMQELKKNIK